MLERLLRLFKRLVGLLTVQVQRQLLENYLPAQHTSPVLQNRHHLGKKTTVPISRERARKLEALDSLRENCVVLQ